VRGTRPPDAEFPGETGPDTLAGMPSLARLVLPLFALAVAFAAGGCGIAYECRWKNAGTQPTPAQGINGRWQGEWHSEGSGHSGGLRCILTRDADGHYVADFRATYAWLLSFGYRMTLTTKATDDGHPPSVVYFEGKEDAGWLGGGVYAYDGKVTPMAFHFNYAGTWDHGTFLLARPGGATEK
jgi:hypothetical protein